MDKLLALAAFLLSLFGFDVQRSTFESREISNGRELLHARATLEAGVARFECLASTTGLCYWAVYPARCADDASACTSRPLRRFALAVDDTRQVTGLSRVRTCVSGSAATAAPACHALGDEPQ